MAPYTICRNYEQFVVAVERYYKHIGKAPELICFDHDLDAEHYDPDYKGDYKEKTGFDCAKWLCEFCAENDLKFPPYIIHSMNPVGAANIESIIQSFKKSCER